MPRESRSYRTQALILKRRDLGEADRLLTLLTPDHGKVDAVAKGARKPTSSKTGHVELYTRAEVLIARGRDLDILVQAEMVEPYLPLREDLTRSAYASYAVELLDRFTYGGDVDLNGLFELLDETLMRICYDTDVRRSLRYYELKLLDHAGFRPELMQCVITQEPLLPEDQFFSTFEGGVVSREAAPHSAGLIGLPMLTLKLLRHLQRSNYQQIAQLQIDDSLHNDAERIMLNYIRYILESKLQSIDFIRRVRQFT